MNKFQDSIKALTEASNAFAAGSIKPVPYADLREKHLLEALVAMGAELGVNLEKHISFTSLGEVSIIAIAGDGKDPRLGCGEFGEDFAEYLNRFHPRMGTLPGSVEPEDGWCYMNHLEVERMVLAYAADTANKS